jgi:hypothetical protein
LSTHALIARPTPDGGWEGRYVHYDVFPEDKVPLLLAARNAPRFVGDETALATFLVDEHPAGWDILGADLAGPDSEAASFLQATIAEHSECLCHNWEGALQEPPMTDGDAATRDDILWIYVLRPEGLEVISRERNPDDLRGLILPWSTDPTEAFPGSRFQGWQPTTPRTKRTPRFSPPATATTVTMISRRPPRR